MWTRKVKSASQAEGESQGCISGLSRVTGTKDSISNVGWTNNALWPGEAPDHSRQAGGPGRLPAPPSTPTAAGEQHGPSSPLPQKSQSGPCKAHLSPPLPGLWSHPWTRRVQPAPVLRVCSSKFTPVLRWQESRWPVYGLNRVP